MWLFFFFCIRYFFLKHLCIKFLRSASWLLVHNTTRVWGAGMRPVSWSCRKGHVIVLKKSSRLLSKWIYILSGPLPVLFVSPVSPSLPDLFHCFVLWSSLSTACCLSLYLFAIVWCVFLLHFMCFGLLHILFAKLYVSLSFSFVWCVSLLYLFSALVFLSSLCIVYNNNKIGFS